MHVSKKQITIGLGVVLIILVIIGTIILVQQKDRNNDSTENSEIISSEITEIYLEETENVENGTEILSEAVLNSELESLNIEDNIQSSQPNWTVTDMDQTMYAKASVNVRKGPGTEYERLGSLSTNQEVKVTGKCNEFDWYRIGYNNEIAYVSINYLVSEKLIEADSNNQYQNNNSSEQNGDKICIGFDENGNLEFITEEEWEYMNSEEYLLANGVSSAATTYAPSSDYVVYDYYPSDGYEYVEVSFWWEPIEWVSPRPSYFVWDVYCNNWDYNAAKGNALKYMPSCPTYEESYRLYTGGIFKFGISECDKYGETTLYVRKSE